jgi:hypothetical protein
MTLAPKLRSGLYRWGRILGDVSAVERSVKTGSPQPVVKRLERRALGRLAGRAIGRFVR